LNVGGIQVNVHSVFPIDVPSPKPVVVMFLLHGRQEQADQYDHVVRDLLADNLARGSVSDLVVLTFVCMASGFMVISSQYSMRITEIIASEWWIKRLTMDGIKILNYQTTCMRER
jgi:hypothetical protein